MSESRVQGGIQQQRNLPKGYENKMLILTMCAFGFVMFDRFALANLQSYIIADLGLTYTQLGLATSVFAVSWAIAGFFVSALADSTASHRKMLALLVLLYSLCSMATGLATGVVMLIVIRMLMGIFEGPVMPIAMGFCIPQSSPHRRGLNVGLLQVVAVGLFATFLGPLVQVRLAENIGWRWTFVSTIIPGIIIAWLIYKVLIDPTVGAHKAADRAGHAEKPAEKPEKGAILKALLTRNIALSVIGSFFLYCWYVCMLTYLPSYLMQVVKLTPIDMSYVMSALGVGSIVWGVVLPKASDSLGRKPLTIVGLIMACAGTFGLLYMPHSLGVLIAIAFVAWAGNGVFALLATTIPTESGDPRFSASITGFVQLTGELVGATAGAIIIGHVADIEGLTTAVSILGVLIAVPIVTSLFYKETAPAVLAKRQEEAGVA